MKGTLLALLVALSAVAHAQQAPDGDQGNGYAGPYGEKHAEEKRREQVAIAVRVRQNLRIEADRKERQYAENRRRCQEALRVAELCGKFAGTFYCDEKGFQSITANVAIKPAAMDNVDRYNMERCVRDAVKRDP